MEFNINRRLTRRQWLKGAAALSLGAAGVATFAGCSEREARDSDDITLTVLIPEHWDVVNGIRENDPELVPPRRLWFYERVKQWEEERPEIQLDWQTAAWEQLPVNFITASQAGNAPDIVTFDANYLYSVTQGGYLAPLDDFDYDEWNDFNPYVQDEILSIDGKKYGLSNYLASWGLLYNERLLAEAGFDSPPTTWEEVIEQGKLLTRDTRGTGRPDQWGFGALMMGELNQTPPGHFASMVWSQGGDIMDEDRMALINTAEMHDSVQLIVDFINEHEIMSSDTITLKANDEIDQLANEIWATGLAITSYYPPVADALGEDNVGFSGFPVFSGGDSFGPVEVFGWHMSTQTAEEDDDRAEAAFEWMSFMAANETLILAAEHQFGQPSRQSVLDDPVFTADPVLEFMAEYTATRGRPVPHMVEKEYWMESLMEGVHSAILGQTTVEEALETAQERYDDRAARS